MCTVFTSTCTHYRTLNDVNDRSYVSLADGMHPWVVRRRADGVVMRRCFRGTNHLEGYHPTSNALLSGNNNSPAFAHFRHADRMVRWTLDQWSRWG